MPDALIRLSRQLRRPGLSGGLTLLVSQALTGCECPEPAWLHHTVAATGDPTVEREIEAFFAEAGPDADPRTLLDLLYGVQRGDTPPPMFPPGYVGPAQHAQLEALGASAAHALCNAVCEPDDDDSGALPGARTHCDADVVDGRPVVRCHLLQPVECVAGRRPAGLRSRGAEAHAPTQRGRFWAAIAHEEAAAVHAFVALADALRALDAPPALVAATEAAVRDELRHVALAVGRAHALGAQVPPLEVEPAPTPDALTLALSNAEAGCVRESLAALEAIWGATHAEDPADRAALQVIAVDEAHHADLSWALHHWLRGRLDPEGQMRLDDALSRAFARVEAELGARDPRGTPLPPATEAIRRLQTLAA